MSPREIYRLEQPEFVHFDSDGRIVSITMLGSAHSFEVVMQMIAEADAKLEQRRKDARENATPDEG